MPYAISTPRKRARSTSMSSSGTRSNQVRKKIYTSIPRSISVGKAGFPKILKNTLKYTDAVVMTVTAGAGSYLFSCNGLYDPNITGTGHQPMYFDQLMAVYDHYTVTSSRIKAYYVPDSTITTGFMVTLYIDDDTATHATGLAAAERDSCKSVVIRPSSQVTTVLYNSWNAVKYFGPNPLANDNLQGSSSANPTEQSYFVCQGYDFSGAASGLRLYVEIEYDVTWDELATTAQS